MKNIRRYYPGLDFLRSIAIVMVLCRHGLRGYALSTGNEWILEHNSWWKTAMMNGWLGVDLFFVLSGFLITQHIYHYWSSPVPSFTQVKHYLKHRLLRVLPPYYLFLFIVAAGFVPFYSPSVNFFSFRFLYHLLFLQDYISSNIVVAFWSLGTEIKFYLLMPSLYILLTRYSPKKKVISILTIILLIWCCRYVTVNAFYIQSYEAYFTILRSPFHLSFDGLLLGSLASILLNQKQVNLYLKATCHVLFVVCISLLSAIIFNIDIVNIYVHSDPVFLPTVFPLIFALMLVSIVVLQDQHNIAVSIPGCKFIARLSYSLYLVHMTLIPVSIITTKNLIKTEANFWIYFLTYLVFSFIGGFFLHLAAERPYFRMIRKANTTTVRVQS